MEYQLGLYEKSMPGSLTLRQKLAAARRAGYDYLELSIDETDEKLARLHWGEREIRALRAAQDETGVPVKSICLSGHRRFPLGHPDVEQQRKSLAIMHSAVALAARLGVRAIQIAGYDVYYEKRSEQTRENFARNLALCADMAASEGVLLAFETMETDFLDTVGKALYWVQRVNSPYLQIYPDTGNITNAALLYGTSPLEDLKAGAGHLAALHLKESRPGQYREVPYGTGNVDFAGLAGAALDLGVRMFVGEFWYLGEEDWPDMLEQNQKFLRKKLQRVQTAGNRGAQGSNTYNKL